MVADCMPESKRRKPKHRPQSQEAIAAATKDKDPSPTWYVILMAGLMVIGVVLVLVRFILQMDQMVLVAGLGFITVGFIMTTGYR
jgi:Cell division protein CrgA